MAEDKTARWDGRRQAVRYMEQRLGRLLNRIDSPASRAQLAQLRRSVSKLPGEVPETWEIEFANMPSMLAGTGANPPTPGEWAIHLALSLFAVHQQSQALPMHRACNWKQRELYGLGHAVRRLVALSQGEQLEPGQMPRRFSALVTADSIEEVAHYLRQIVQQLRAASLPLDYARLAGQLYDFQQQHLRDRVRLEWGREFSEAPASSESAANDTFAEATSN